MRILIGGVNVFSHQGSRELPQKTQWCAKRTLGMPTLSLRRVPTLWFPPSGLWFSPVMFYETRLRKAALSTWQMRNAQVVIKDNGNYSTGEWMQNPEKGCPTPTNRNRHASRQPWWQQHPPLAPPHAVGGSICQITLCVISNVRKYHHFFGADYLWLGFLRSDV